uniref:Uncharacterized protein n=1 Tax=Strongyloides venezuelensis TaxID=75913 RepID=A0A0K0FEX7_STRVS
MPNFVQKDLFSRNSIIQDFSVFSINEDNENKYFRKRQADGKEEQNEQKIPTKIKNKKKLKLKYLQLKSLFLGERPLSLKRLLRKRTTRMTVTKKTATGRS